MSSEPTDYTKLAKDFITVYVYKHSLPKYNGTPGTDSECPGCKLSKAPSHNWHEVSLCEKDLGGIHEMHESSHTFLNLDQTNIIVKPAQLAYCIDMSGDLLKV